MFHVTTLELQHSKCQHDLCCNDMYVNGMADGIQKNLGDRLREARTLAGFRSMTKAAERVGKTASTYRAHENGQNEYSHSDAETYAAAFGVSADWLMFGGDKPYSDWKPSAQKATPEPPSGIAVPLAIIGEVAAGLWAEADLFQEEYANASQAELLSIAPHPNYPASAQYVVRVRGESLNKIAANGDLLLCVDYLSANIEPKPGDLSLIERSRDGGMTIERTAKRIAVLGGQVELMPESTDPKFQTKIVYREGDEDHTEVKIKAKVVMAFKPI